MSDRSSLVRARIPADMKREVELILRDLGLTHARAIELFYEHVAWRRGFHSRRTPTISTRVPRRRKARRPEKIERIG